MWTALAYLAMFGAFLFPWFFLHTIRRMLNQEKYGVLLFISSVCFGLPVLVMIWRIA